MCYRPYGRVEESHEKPPRYCYTTLLGEIVTDYGLKDRVSIDS
jgi:hypothetical protein